MSDEKKIEIVLTSLRVFVRKLENLSRRKDDPMADTYNTLASDAQEVLEELENAWRG